MRIIDNTLNIIGASMKNKNIILKKDFQANIEISTYANELKQVVLNLIKNAEDVLLEKYILNPMIWIKTYKDENKVYLEVADNAGGIAKSIQNKIFEPYFTTKEKRDGTGLGLYMSKVIVEDHCKGKIVVKNDKNGAVFKISLGIENG